LTQIVLVAAPAAIAAGALGAASRTRFALSLAVQAGGAVALAAAGFAVLATGRALGSGFSSGFSPALGVDPLSGFFLGTLGVVAAAAFLSSPGYLQRDTRGRVVGGLTGAFVLALALVLSCSLRR
jgi:formate hydrogenlyase subunit 3/multisubunit Na+/H+ antiporter MnhD subunit